MNNLELLQNFQRTRRMPLFIVLEEEITRYMGQVLSRYLLERHSQMTDCYATFDTNCSKQNAYIIGF